MIFGRLLYSKRTQDRVRLFLHSMQITSLKRKFDALQRRHGDPALRAIYGAGCVSRPDVCFVFMNPTGRNVAASPRWKGLHAPWIGTKHAWNLFTKLGLFDAVLNERIQTTPPEAWTPAFAGEVYRHVAARRLYITNLAKCTQADARHQRDDVFRAYLPSLHEEIAAVNPRAIVAFGNQVNSVMLGRPVNVSQCRKTSVPFAASGKTFGVHPVCYPVGQGMRNMGKAIEDVRWIMRKTCLEEAGF